MQLINRDSLTITAKQTFVDWFTVEYHSMVYDMVVGKAIDKDEENELTDQALGAIRGLSNR